VPAKAPSFEHPEARALEASLELGATRNRLEALARRTGVARTQGWLPDVAADVHALQGNPESASGGTDTSWQFGYGVSVRVRLFDRQQGATRALEAEFDALLERYQGMAVDIRSAVRDAKNRVVSSHARARKFQQVILPAQRAVTEQTLLQYNAMQVAVFQLLQARRDELDVELAYVDTLREYFSAAAALDALFAGRRVTPVGAVGAASLSAGTDSPGGH
jgi:outer membrane protein TolC